MPSAASARSKGMLLVEGDPDCRSAGSFFKNPIVDEAVIPRLAQILNIDTDKVPRYPAAPGPAAHRSGHSFPRRGCSNRPAFTRDSSWGRPASPHATPSPSSIAATPSPRTSWLSAI